jgi:hypothetical protein
MASEMGAQKARVADLEDLAQCAQKLGFGAAPDLGAAASILERQEETATLERRTWLSRERGCGDQRGE